MSEVKDDMENTLMNRQEEDTKLEYEVAQQIISLRKSLGLSQKELAEKLNTRQSAISRIEKGEQNISIGLLEKIADALGVEVNVSLNVTRQVVPATTVPSSQTNTAQPGGQVNPIGGTYHTASRKNNNNVY